MRCRRMDTKHCELPKDEYETLKDSLFEGLIGGGKIYEGSIPEDQI